MNDFNYYKSKEIYREKYYQMPKVFFTNENTWIYQMMQKLLICYLKIDLIIQSK